MEGETEGTEVEESTETVPAQEGKDNSSVTVVGIVIAVLVVVLAVVVYKKKKQ